MSPVKKILTDPAVYGLVALNAYFIYAFKDDPAKYNSIVILYWVQSFLIGFQTFFELLTTRNTIATGFKMNNEPVNPEKGRGCYSTFFLLHYEGFHLGYLFFLLVTLNLSMVDFSFIKISALGILCSMVLVFIQHKIAYRQHPPSLGKLFFTPYLRIVPMHLMIVLPSFFHWSPALVFLLLKAVFDVIGHIVTTPYYFKQNTTVPQNEYV